MASNGPVEEPTMPTYEIEQYEIYVQRYRIEATDEVHAITRLFGGEAKPVENSLEYVEVSHDNGLSPDEDWELAQALWDAGAITAIDLVIPSIRSIKQMETQETES